MRISVVFCISGTRFAEIRLCVFKLFAKVALLLLLVGTMNRIASQSIVPESSRISLAGCLLVASPSVRTGVFGQSVCLVLEHSQDRALGIVLNKPMQVSFSTFLSEVVPDLSKDTANKLLHFGGPESGPILAIHNTPELAEGGNQLGVYLSAQMSHLKQLAQSNVVQLKFYAGSSVWGPLELDHQVVSGNWHVLPAIPDIVFEDESRMWSKAMRSIANQIYSESTGLDLRGYDCSLN